MLDFDRFQAMTFDCYGTMIDWETGLAAAFRPVFAAHGVNVPIEQALELFGELEAAAEHGEYATYRTVLARTLAGIGERLGFAPSDAELATFAQSVKEWPPFSDSPVALAALQRRYKLAVISNVDDDLFAASEKKLGVKFDWVITAQQVRSYKPSLNNFEVALARIGVARERVLHVAQSLYHDIAPARSLGLSTIWVNRRQGKTGAGATPGSAAKPDLEVASLGALVAVIGGTNVSGYGH